MSERVPEELFSFAKEKPSLKRTPSVSLQDFEIRYKNIRASKPEVKKCSVSGCHNPRDSTKLLGEDTCCAYHRLLFDFWMCDVASIRGHEVTSMSQKGRRRAFTNWRNRTGKTRLDEIVLRMAKEPINWEC